MMKSRLLGIMAVVVPILWAAQVPAAPVFTVASIKPNAGGLTPAAWCSWPYTVRPAASESTMGRRTRQLPIYALVVDWV
jgi:hypothetical protein